MQDIQTVAFIGLGAVGINFAQWMRNALPKQQVRIVADAERIERYRRDGVFYNGKPCDFYYVNDEDKMPSADLVIFTTKAYGLVDAMKSMRHQIDDHTLIMSAINGITSEAILGRVYRKENIIYTVSQGMDATKIGNQVTCHHMGELSFGAVDEEQREKVERIHRFFASIAFPHTLRDDILHHQWGKFMLNVGLNQVVAACQGTYETIQKAGAARDRMIAAMQEVVRLSTYEGICLSEQELYAWLVSCNNLDKDGMPSMAQDVKAKRKTEVELFAGEVCKRSKRYHMDCPINEVLYRELTEMEHQYQNDNDK